MTEKKIKKKTNRKTQDTPVKRDHQEHVSQLIRLKDRYLLPSFLRQMKKLQISGLTGGNEIEIITRGGLFISSIMAALETAAKSINFETYIFDSDETGWEVARLLAQKAGEGVEVNLIYDAVGCLGTSPSIFTFLKDAGVEVIEFNPLVPLKKAWSPGYRDHRKILVVDGETAFIGGNNIGNDYSGSLFNSTAWRDTHVKITGPAVRDIQYIFIENWYRNGGALINHVNYFPDIKDTGKKIIMILGSRSRKKTLRPIVESYLSAINNAQKYIYITNAYFVPDGGIYRALVHAADKGVDVRIMMPEKSDIKIIEFASHYLYKRFLKNGIRLYEYQPSMLHAKTAVIDGIWTTIGSSNLDMVTSKRNLEINGVILDHDTGEEMKDIFFEDLEACKEITLDEWERRSLLLFILEWISYRIITML